MKHFGTLVLLLLTVSLPAHPQKNDACSARMTKVMELLREARSCQRDSDCALTQEFSNKLICGKNVPVHKKADLKKIFEVIDSIQNCPGGGSCLHQDEAKPYKVKCIQKECSIIE